MKPITIYWRPYVPNPAKVIIICEELNLPYVGKFIDITELKQPVYESINPNGRVPAIYDPNTDLTLWESGAIVTYLIDQYDVDHKLTILTFPEKHHLLQWQHYQSSGQGPYFGQAAWFLLYHSEPLESAKRRYAIETVRIISVLDKALDGRQWLVGNKCTYADLAYVAWNASVGLFMEGQPEWKPENFQNYIRWQQSMMDRPSVQKALSFTKEEEVKG